MAKKRVAIKDVFGDNQRQSEGIPVEDADAQGYGTITIGASARHKKVKAINIFSIFPDPAQPRRAIPAAVSGNWTANPGEMQEFLKHWAQFTELDISLYLSEYPDFDRPDYTDQVKIALMNLIDLAVSIRGEGLSNPITVARIGETYRIETGERRWMAYHLLHTYDPNGDWANIPARDVGEYSVWRQAAENGARENLNAIAKSRQLAMLLMDLLSKRSCDFASYIEVVEEGRHEREYYAQVADAQKYRVPRGTGSQLVGTIGLKHTKQLQHYRNLLGLPNPVWEAADDLNWTENRLRPLTSLPHSEIIQIAAKWALKEGYMGTVVPLYDGTRDKPAERVGGFDRIMNRIPQSKDLDNLTGKEREQVLDELQTLINRYRES